MPIYIVNNLKILVVIGGGIRFDGETELSGSREILLKAYWCGRLVGENDERVTG